MPEEKKKILIVEDDELTLRMLSDAFRNEGLYVMQAINGKEALDMALRECPNLILLDVVIPEIDGIQVLKRLRKDGCCKDIPIIVMTNLEGTEVVDEALNAGRCDFMIKTDWVISDIVKRVKGHLENK
jgi:CheY-like chemotaxis protein